MRVDVATGRLLRELTGHEDAVYAVGISPDGKMAVTGGADKTVRVWDLAKGTEPSARIITPGALIQEWTISSMEWAALR